MFRTGYKGIEYNIEDISALSTPHGMLIHKLKGKLSKYVVPGSPCTYSHSIVSIFQSEVSSVNAQFSKSPCALGDILAVNSGAYGPVA